MAILVPDLKEINSLPQKLTDGEKALMNALLQALDDGWTVYVQPHLNGLRPQYGSVKEFSRQEWTLVTR